jgi:hypothetical protein
MKNIYLGFFKFYQPKATGGGFSFLNGPHKTTRLVKIGGQKILEYFCEFCKML